MAGSEKAMKPLEEIIALVNEAKTAETTGEPNKHGRRRVEKGAGQQKGYGAKGSEDCLRILGCAWRSQLLIRGHGDREELGHGQRNQSQEQERPLSTTG